MPDFFNLHFAEFTMSFHLNDTPVTRAWCKTFVDGAALGDIQRVFLTEGLVERIQPYMTEAVRTISKTFPGFEEVWAQGFSRETMNTLHAMFHDCFEDPAKQAITPDDVRAALQTVNLIVHVWDTYSKTNSSNREHWVAARLVDIDESKFEPIQTWMWREWNYRYHYYGDLRLGYYTLGKSLYDCYLDDDVHVVEHGLARPQRVISNQFFIDLREQNDPYSGHKTEQIVHASMRKWAMAHGVDYADHPAYKAKCQPLLGRLVTKHDLSVLEEAWNTEVPRWSFI